MLDLSLILNLTYVDVFIGTTSAVLGLTTGVIYSQAIKTKVKSYAITILEKSIDFYVDLKWYVKNTNDEKDLNNGLNISWDLKTEDYGIYKINDNRYLSFKVDIDLSKIEFNMCKDDVQIENIKLFNFKIQYVNDTLPIEKFNIIKQTLAMCCGPNCTFPCGVPKMEQLRKFNDAFLDVTKIIINLNNYEEYIIF